MKIIKRYLACRVPKVHIEQILTVLKTRPDYLLDWDGKMGLLNFGVPETSPDSHAFEDYCNKNKIHFSMVRRRIYSKAELESVQYFFLATETDASDTDDTKLSNEGACPVCGVGLKQVGPLIVNTQEPRLPKKRLFCVSLRQSREWIISAELIDLFKDFSGIHFDEVCAASQPTKPLGFLKQIIIENHLPRMATVTNFEEYAPPLENRCSCNRAGWRLHDEIVYVQDALKNAKDFNMTVERWYGGGPVGLNWPIVSQKVRQTILKHKLLRSGCLEPIRIIERDSGNQHKFDLPLDMHL